MMRLNADWLMVQLYSYRLWSELMTGRQVSLVVWSGRLILTQNN